MFDCIIIGKGPAGISCAIYLARAKYKVLVIGKDFGALEANHYIDNYYGYEHILGKDLLRKGVEQASSFGVNVVSEEVVAINIQDGFKVETNNDNYLSKTVFLAPGKEKISLDKINLKEFDGRGVSYCAICDGFIYRNKNIGILGSGDYMKKELESLRRFTPNITIFTNGNDCDVTDLKIVKDKVLNIVGEKKISGVNTESGFYPIDGLFVALGSAGSVSFAKHLGLLCDEKDNIIVNNYQTNVPGIFAGGDAIGGLNQIVKAASDGACASLAIIKYLKGEKNE